MKHSLTDKDKVALTALCSVCGPDTKIVKNSQYGFACVVGRREAKDRYKEAHPDRVRQSKKRPSSTHRLTNRDGTPDTCAICGPVNPVVMGRGWGCPVRAAEIGRKVFAESPQPACPICRTYLDRFGGCAKCDDDLADLDAKFLPAESRAAKRNYHANRGHLEGFTIIDIAAPYGLVDADTSVTPQLKVIGSPLPAATTVRPDYARLFGSGSR